MFSAGTSPWCDVANQRPTTPTDAARTPITAKILRRCVPDVAVRRGATESVRNEYRRSRRKNRFGSVLVVRRYSFGQRRLFSLRDPAKPKPGDSVNNSLIFAVVTKRSPQLAHQVAKLHVRDVGASPHCSDQLVATYCAVAVHHKVSQAVKDLWRHRKQSSRAT